MNKFIQYTVFFTIFSSIIIHYETIAMEKEEHKKEIKNNIIDYQKPDKLEELNYYEKRSDKSDIMSLKANKKRVYELLLLKKMASSDSYIFCFSYINHEEKIKYILIEYPFCLLLKKKSQYSLTWNNIGSEIMLWKKENTKFKKISSFFLPNSKDNKLYLLAIQFILLNNIHPGVIFLNTGQQLISDCVEQLRINKYKPLHTITDSRTKTLSVMI